MLDGYICPLCDRNPAGYKRVYENSDFWVAVHEETKTPTVVLKEHRTKVYPDEIVEMKRVCKSLFKMELFEMVPNADKHYHIKLRLKEIPVVNVDDGGSDGQRQKKAKNKTSKKQEK